MPRGNRVYPSAATAAAIPAHIDLTSGIEWPLNYVAQGDCRLVWSGANLLPRTSHTAIWKARYKQPVAASGNYIAVAWHTPNTGSWDFGGYSFGTHPWPASDGTYDGSGQGLTGDAGASGNYWMEIAGVTGANDKIALPMTPAMQMVPDGRWLTQARVAEVSGSNTVHRFYPDVLNYPSSYIEKTIATSSITSPGNPAFYFGASDWSVTNTNQTSESPCAVLRHLLLYNAALDQATIEAKAARTTDDSGGSCWYSNINPTPSDITDKSGAGHTPSWANANRPTLWTP